MSEGNAAPKPAWYTVRRWPLRAFGALMVAVLARRPPPLDGDPGPVATGWVIWASVCVVWAWVVWTGGHNEDRMGPRERIAVWASVGAFALCVAGRWVGVGPLAHG